MASSSSPGISLMQEVISYYMAGEPATLKSTKTSTHEGEEFIFVLEDEMEVTLGNHTDILYPGDSIYYDSTIPHRVQCRKDKETKILAVLYTSKT